jgi:serine/threonine protein kinase
MSNESILGASDIWAMGETVFRFLINKPCFDHPTKRKFYAQGKCSLPIDSLLKHNISDDGIAFIESLMAVSPEKRPTADQALNLQWMHSYSNAAAIPTPPTIDLENVAW